MRRIRALHNPVTPRGPTAVPPSPRPKGLLHAAMPASIRQRQQALEKAAEVRRKRRDLKAQLKNGNQSLAEVLKSPEDDT